MDDKKEMTAEEKEARLAELKAKENRTDEEEKELQGMLEEEVQGPAV